jgi:hypothetical protein
MGVNNRIVLGSEVFRQTNMVGMSMGQDNSLDLFRYGPDLV